MGEGASWGSQVTRCRGVGCKQQGSRAHCGFAALVGWRRRNGQVALSFSSSRAQTFDMPVRPAAPATPRTLPARLPPPRRALKSRCTNNTPTSRPVKQTCPPIDDAEVVQLHSDLFDAEVKFVEERRAKEQAMKRIEQLERQLSANGVSPTSRSTASKIPVLRTPTPSRVHAERGSSPDKSVASCSSAGVTFAHVSTASSVDTVCVRDARTKQTLDVPSHQLCAALVGMHVAREAVLRQEHAKAMSVMAAQLHDLRDQHVQKEAALQVCAAALGATPLHKPSALPRDPPSGHLYARVQARVQELEQRAFTAVGQHLGQLLAQTAFW